MVCKVPVYLKRCLAVIDSGAAVSIISQECAPTLNKAMSTYSGPLLKGAADQTVELIGLIKANIWVARVTLRMTLIFSPIYEHDWLLENKFLEATNLVINYATRSVHAYENPSSSGQFFSLSGI